MLKKIQIIIAFIFLSQMCYSQFNDTLFYQSGNIKIVEITNKTSEYIEYRYVKANQDTAKTSTPLFTISRYVIYDNENVLQFTSTGNSIKDSKGNLADIKSYKSNDLSRSSITYWPICFASPVLGMSYNLKIGKKLRWIWTNRACYSFTFFDGEKNFGSTFLTSRIHFNTLIGEKITWSNGISPTIHISFNSYSSPEFYLPISTGFEFNIGPLWSIEFNAGIGPIYGTKTNSFYSEPAFNLDLGLTKQIGKTVPIPMK